MTVKELIEELSKIPGDYEVEVVLNELAEADASEQEFEQAMDNIVAISAYVYAASPNDEDQLAYVFGSAIPDE